MTDTSALNGLGKRMNRVEEAIETLEIKLDTIVQIFHRVQWTFTGLVIYYIIDHAGLGKLLNLIVKGLLDSSPTKWGKQFGDLKCYSPDTVDLKAGDTIIISSYASEKEIYESLEKYRRIGVTIIRLYGGIME